MSQSHPAAPPQQSALQICFAFARSEHHALGPVGWGIEEAVLRPAAVNVTIASHTNTDPVFSSANLEPGAAQALNKMQGMIGDLLKNSGDMNLGFSVVSRSRLASQAGW